MRIPWRAVWEGVKASGLAAWLIEKVGKRLQPYLPKLSRAKDELEASKHANPGAPE